VGARPQRNETVHGGRIWGKEVNTFFAFSFGEKVAESRMRGYFKLLIFLAFPFTKFPHPPLTWSPLSQNGRGFFKALPTRRSANGRGFLSR
ncbi:MAG: hypothetical protein ACO3NI_17535, partial [bacterium]